MKLNAAIKNMTTQIADVLSLNDPSVYIYGCLLYTSFHLAFFAGFGSGFQLFILCQKVVYRDLVFFELPGEVLHLRKPLFQQGEGFLFLLSGIERGNTCLLYTSWATLWPRLSLREASRKSATVSSVIMQSVRVLSRITGAAPGSAQQPAPTTSPRSRIDVYKRQISICTRR